MLKFITIVALVTTAACGTGAILAESDSGTPTAPSSAADSGSVDAGSDSTDGAPAGDSSESYDAASYDGPLNAPVPCPEAGWPKPCVSGPEVVYSCRCEQIHCVDGQMVPIPGSHPPCG